SITLVSTRVTRLVTKTVGTGSVAALARGTAALLARHGKTVAASRARVGMVRRRTTWTFIFIVKIAVDSVICVDLNHRQTRGKRPQNPAFRAVGKHCPKDTAVQARGCPEPRTGGADCCRTSNKNDARPAAKQRRP